MNKTNKSHSAAYLIVAWLILRVVVLLRYNNFTTDDGYFLNIAENALRGRLRLPLFDSAMGSETYFFALGFTQHYLTAAMLKLFGFSSWFWAAKIPTLLESLLLLSLAALYAKKKQWPPLHTLILVSIIAFEPYFWLHAGYLRPDILCLLFTSLAYIMCREALFGNSRRRAVVAAGLFAGLALLTKWESFVIFPVAAVIFLLCSNNLKTAIKNTAVFSAAAAAVCAPVFLWICSDDVKTRILIEQLNSGKAIIYAQLIHQPFFTAIYKTGLHYLLDFGSLAVAMGYESAYQSAAALVIAAVFIHSLLNIRDARDRFWALLIFTSLTIIAVVSLELKGQRVFMLYPVIAYRFVTITRERPRETITSVFISAIVLIAAAAALKYKQVISADGLATNIAAISVAAFAALSAIAAIHLRNRPGDIKKASNAAAAGMALLATMLIIRSASATIADPGYFYPRNLEPLRRQIHDRLTGRPLTVVAQPQFYPLFPPNCKIYTSDLFTNRINYRYWPTYHDFFNHIGADAILLTSDARKYWSRDEYAERYITQYFFPAGDFDSNGKTFLLFFNRKFIRR